MKVDSGEVLAAYQLFKQHQQLVAQRSRLDAEITLLEKQMSQVSIQVQPDDPLPAPPIPVAAPPEPEADPPLPQAYSEVGRRANAQALVFRALEKNNKLDYGALTEAIYGQDRRINRRRLTQRLRYMAKLKLIRNVSYGVWEVLYAEDEDGGDD